MIRITRPTNIPAILTGNGAKETAANNLKYSKAAARYNNGKNKFKIKGSIYNAPAVKAALKAAQFTKCCFCEKTQGDEYGAIEHYRPKGGYKARRGDRLRKPGYYWQGYIWSNLLFVCEPCNKKKGNIFPLQIEGSRSLNHLGNITNERPLLLDPAGRKNPRKHIKFDDQFVRGISTEGRQTVEICKLDRYSLNEERLNVLKELEERSLQIVANKDAAAVARAIDYLQKSILPNAPFSAMAQDFITKSPVFSTT